MASVRVGPKRQITIPKAVSNRLHLEPGDLVEVRAEGGGWSWSPSALSTGRLRRR